MSEAKDNFSEKLVELRRQFAARLVEDIDTLGALIPVRGGDMPPQTREDIRRIAHRLAGAAGTFSFSQLTEPAVELEQGILDGRDGRAIAGLVNSLCKDIEDGLSSDPDAPASLEAWRASKAGADAAPV